ncbi:MAG TPA: cytochrome c3 family protein [Actinomycetota bacterium]|jgi:hypothetical protein|nr:cytochrome c3 family protein [Actinomycetota bacterium]
MNGMRRATSRGLIVLMVAVVVSVIVEAALVVAVFVSPTAADKLKEIAAAADRAWNGSDDGPGLRTRAARAADDAFEGWVAPLWRGPEAPDPDPGFTACVDCHPDYASTRRFAVYMDHPLHAEIGVACETCHPSNPHPDPPRPQEAVCADCHAEVQEQESCALCHPPGSLPHFYLLGAERSSAVRCDVCHPKGTFATHADQPRIHPGDLTGANEEICLSCHEEETCASCHAEPHPPDWPSTHGESVGFVGAASCITCHSTTWCADRCHAVTDTNPFVPKPLPTSGASPG